MIKREGRVYGIKLLLLLPSLAAVFFLAPATAVGQQYRGDAVVKDGLLQALRSKKFQSRDIVNIIQTNGVNFKLDSATEAELVAAGARPSVIEAIRNNYRVPVITPVNNKPLTAKNMGSKQATKMASNNAQPKDAYNLLLQRAMDFYDNQKNRQAANDTLQEAVRLKPQNPRAYQLLGFLNLYGARNFDEAERYWRTAIDLGGSAVLRVIHDHNGTFITSCQGSLYIARDTVRFESDDNKHTFETRDENIKEVKVNSIFKRLVQVRQGSFKVALRKDSKDDETNFSFAPLSGSTDESKMIIRLVGKKSD